MLSLVLASALMSAPADAGEVLVPEFTPLIAEDFTLAYMFYSLVIDELRQRGVPMIDGDSLRDRAGSDAESCADSITCPSGLWPYYPSADMALVGSVGLFGVGTSEESIEVRVAFFERDGFEPLKTVERTLVPGQEADFAIALAKATDVLLERMNEPSAPSPEPVAEPRDDGSSRRDRRRPSGDKAEADEPKEEELYKSYYGVDEPEGRAPRERTKPSRQPRERSRDVVSSEPSRPPRPRPDASDHQLLSAEVWAGLAIGDVRRSYDVRVSILDAGDSDLGRYEHDAFTAGVGGDLELGLMVSPTPWLRAGLRLGFISGRKFLSTGYELWSQGDQASAEIQDYKPAAALQGVIEPRVVIAPVAFGAFRPSLHASLGLRRYDGYEIAASGQLDYPDRNGGWQAYPGGGLGLSYDLGSGRGVGLELDHAVRLGDDGVHHVQQGLVTEFPEIPEPSSRTTTVMVGFTQRFL
jgi:hypothetical protein